jgi:hypothetical protein
VVFEVFATRNDLPAGEREEARELFFSKGQACFRTSPLTNTYGFGVHCDSAGRMAVYGMETDEYRKFLSDTSVKKVKALKSRK